MKRAFLVIMIWITYSIFIASIMPSGYNGVVVNQLKPSNDAVTNMYFYLSLMSWSWIIPTGLSVFLLKNQIKTLYTKIKENA